MKVIIAGSRSIKSVRTVMQAMVSSGFKFDILVHGGAIGVDSIAGEIARNDDTQEVVFPVSASQWRIQGRRAGPMRNFLMAEYADALVAVWDCHSRGTASMIRIARKAGLEVYVHKAGE